MDGTIWSLVPPILAIILALITKEVYMSLLAGICVGALIYTNFAMEPAIHAVVDVMSEKVGGNICIIIFLVLLGMLVSLMGKSGASRAYGEWSAKNIKTKRSALLATSALGILIFVDDYFNCLTVGTIMSPITDKHKISRAKLAYIIDATAAPVCILAPVSSWAAAVSSSLPTDSGLDGFMLFIEAIPFNYYAILTLIMVFTLIVLDFDFSNMKNYERKHRRELEERQAGTGGNGGNSHMEEESEEGERNRQGTVLDLILPILLLILFCIAAMLYTGGITSGAGLINSFADCDAAFSLVVGSFFTIVVVAFLYLPRHILTFEEFTSSLTEGFKSMVPAILILTFAWTLSGICGSEYLRIGDFVSGVVKNSTISLAVIPVVFFVVSLGLAFSTGTSWGTFSILLPIIFSIFTTDSSHLLILSMSSVMAGAIAGDHMSPISDTTILSSTGAGCVHIDHVNTQLPYALLVAVISAICYVVAGVSGQGYLGLGLGIVLLLVSLNVLKRNGGRQEEA